MALTGPGASMTISASTWTFNVISIDGPSGVSRESVETTHLGTTDAKTFQPEVTYDPGTLAVTVEHDGDLHAQVTQLLGSTDKTHTITVTDQIPTGKSAGATAAASGFLTDYDGPSRQSAGASRLEASLTFKLSGAITFTASSS